MDQEANTSACNNDDGELCEMESKPTLRFCEVCAIVEAKYTCPRCEVKTCSLKCNKLHKLELECSGLRDKAKFIAIKKFTNLDLANDYRFLEEVSRVVEVSKKDRAYRNFRITKRFLTLQREAFNRKITLKYLPLNFVRHKCNTTYYDFGLKMINWRVDWVFVNSGNLKISEEKVQENTRIASILNKYLVKQENQELQERLAFYQAADIPGTKILLKAEMKSGQKFYELDPSDTLSECLKHKLIIEYPTIHLVLRDQATFYDIIDSDDDEEEESKDKLQKQLKSGQEVINKIIKKCECDDSIYESLKNLLFISEYSDEDICENET